MPPVNPHIYQLTPGRSISAGIFPHEIEYIMTEQDLFIVHHSMPSAREYLYFNNSSLKITNFGDHGLDALLIDDAIQYGYLTRSIYSISQCFQATRDALLSSAQLNGYMPFRVELNDRLGIIGISLVRSVGPTYPITFTLKRFDSHGEALGADPIVLPYYRLLEAVTGAHRSAELREEPWLKALSTPDSSVDSKKMTNDGRDTCYACGAPTKCIGVFPASSMRICTACGK